MTSSDRVERHGGAAIGRTVSSCGNPFQRLVSITPDYATRPILEGFSWSECLAGVAEGEWYLVVFRSIRRVGADVAVLTAYDDRAHDEARRSPGFLFYFKGQPDDRRACLSFCLWERLYQAKMASRRPCHVAATRIVAEMYESYRLERYILAKYPDRPDPELQSLL